MNLRTKYVLLAIGTAFFSIAWTMGLTPAWAKAPDEDSPDISLVIKAHVDSSSAGTSQTSQAPQTLPRSLRDAYFAALNRSETVAVQQELLVQNHEGQSQAIGAVMPTITGSWNFLNQPQPSAPIGTSISPSTQNTVKLTADQPLFRGLRDLAALRQKKYLVGMQKQAVLAAAKQLFYDLSTAYYNVLAYKWDVANYKKEIEINETRLKELQGFYKIGRSQLTDVLTFKSNVTSLRVNLENSIGQLEVAKDVLAYLTGWNRDTFLNNAENLRDTEPLYTDIPNIQTLLKEVDNRPDVQLALGNVQAFDEGVPLAWGQHLPNIDLIGDYYFDRPGVVSTVHWDAQIMLSVPLFQGGIVQSQVRQATSVARQYSQLLSQARRLGEEEIRMFHNQLNADRQQISKLTELVEISKKNYETEVRYYRNGLVTNLDVLTAVNTFQDAQRQLDHQRMIVQLDAAKLQAATGKRSEIATALKE